MRRKILIVDDSKLMQRMYDIALTAYGTHAIDQHFANDGHEALTWLAANADVALIFLDVNMPGLSGLELLAIMRAEPAWSNIKVILQSTADHFNEMERGIAIGANAMLIKPFTTVRLHSLLDLALT